MTGSRGGLGEVVIPRYSEGSRGAGASLLLDPSGYRGMTWLGLSDRLERPKPRVRLVPPLRLPRLVPLHVEAAPHDRPRLGQRLHVARGHGLHEDVADGRGL